VYVAPDTLQVQNNLQVMPLQRGQQGSSRLSSRIIPASPPPNELTASQPPNRAVPGRDVLAPVRRRAGGPRRRPYAEKEVHNPVRLALQGRGRRVRTGEGQADERHVAASERDSRRRGWTWR
jgi:hypothetical protein